MILKTTPGFERALAGLPEPKSEAVAAALSNLLVAFGQPHKKLGIRKLRQNIFEFRVGLGLRIVFRREKGALFLLEIGSHDRVRKFLQSF